MADIFWQDTKENRKKQIDKMRRATLRFIEQYPKKKVPREFRQFLPKNLPPEQRPDYGYKKHYA